jgi:uncharacterized ion transporter superfamily protein YfcC
VTVVQHAFAHGRWALCVVAPTSADLLVALAALEAL